VVVGDSWGLALKEEQAGSPSLEDGGEGGDGFLLLAARVVEDRSRVG
jgi:hypothetical protein